ncbi:putative transcription factor TIFY family [Helianthus annuus]|uniref:Protein TIFY n=1 Tax=Helianthus annuus TaxID=4232 RepID=A0A251U388_HELAN|nr:protein TIFY 9 [Helianthus annuus]KAF5793788.1 putative transcription factor TIFY family [Helianthus annuus]KAJ0552109.1 putative transcription factor TIFY family [Helianthus annuus]
MSGIELNHSRPTKKIFHRPQSFRDIQGWISKMNPELVKTVIESGKKPLHSAHYPPTLSLSMPETTPLTIFYNGIVNVFQVSPLQAEAVMKFAYGKETPASPSHNKLQTLNQGKLDVDESCSDLPIARKRSLQRFLKKRKGRVNMGAPY